MPSVTREQVGGVGGAGGYGEGIHFSAPLVSLDNSSKNKVPEISLANFCSKYRIDDDTHALLAYNEFNPVNSIFEIDEAVFINDLCFKVGQIAELRWALRKMLAEEKIEITTSGESSTTDIFGGRGGDGGIGFQRGGEGGTGKPPKISAQDIFRFNEIASGIGGAGGASELPPPEVAKFLAAMQSTAGSRSRKDPILKGGQGGLGGYGSNIGGVGGIGGASQIPAVNVSLFAEISGGTGGGGGFSKVEGGRGGNGEGPDVPSHLVFIDDTTRRRIPHKTLAELGLNAPLRQLLEKNGFRTAGGLFEAYDSYFPPDQFKMGQIALIKSTLKRKFSIT